MNNMLANQEKIAGQHLHSGDNQILFGEKLLKLSLSSRAMKALQSNDQQAHINIELELYFSCLIRKRVNIREQARTDAIFNTDINEKLSISFRPVMTKVCKMSDVVGEPDIENLPILNPKRFTPNWVSLDYKNKQWVGEFGF